MMAAESGASNGVAGLAARRTAARLLAAVVDAHTSLDGLTDNDHGNPQYLALEARDRALTRAIMGAALRHRMTIEALLAARLDRPLPSNARALSHLLHVGAAQILFLDVPDSAAVDLAVEHAKSDPRTKRFAGLVNAVLRELARRKDRALPVVLEKTVDAPDWFRERIASAYGDKAGEIFAMHRLEPAIDFTVKHDATGWADAVGGVVLPTGSVRLDRLDRAPSELPGYGEGLWWVQDAAAALPARMLGDLRGLRVADLCAAPGGKTAQLAQAGARVTAVDSSRNRLRRLKANLERLKLNAEVVEANIESWQPDNLFDAILLDAPCSSTGTVRRHPDVPWTKSLEDVRKLAGLQRRLLDKAIRLVRPGGVLVFSNCSLDPMEGEDLVSAFLAETEEVELMPLLAAEIPGTESFIDPNGMLRTTPADLRLPKLERSGLDGFFAARFRRKT